MQETGGYKTEGYNVGSDKVDSDKTKTVLHQSYTIKKFGLPRGNCNSL